jgi:hypothetical protein
MRAKMRIKMSLDKKPLMVMMKNFTKKFWRQVPLVNKNYSLTLDGQTYQLVKFKQPLHLKVIILQDQDLEALPNQTDSIV